MLAWMRTTMGGLSAVVLMLLALWMWGQSRELAGVLAAGASGPIIELWAVRCAAIAAGSAAQLLFMVFVVAALYRRDAVDETARLFVGTLSCVAMIGAMVLALVGR